MMAERMPIAMLSFYKRVLSPGLRAVAGIFGIAADCRFQPTCSEYATLALAQHGAVRGLGLTAWRVLRCHPLARGGWDPVPLPEPPEGMCTQTVEVARAGDGAQALRGRAGTIEKPHSTHEPV